MTKNIILGLTSIGTLVAVGFLITSPTLAYQGDPNVAGPNCDSAQFEQIKSAIQNRDYNSWQELHGDRGHLSEVITADNFNQFAEANELRQAGDHDGARAIMTELGLDKGKGFGEGGPRGGHGKFRGTNSETQ